MQITRWLIRSANYHRRKRILGGERRRTLHLLLSIGEYLRASIPAGLALVFLAAISAFLIMTADAWFPLRDIRIWRGEVFGFKARWNYSYLQMARVASIKKGSNLQNTTLIGVDLEGTTLEKVDFTEANLKFASLKQANLHRAKLRRAQIKEA